MIKRLIPNRGPFLKQHISYVLLILIIDQLSKWFILNELMLETKGSIPLLPFLSFSMVWNSGISMGLAIDNIIGDWGVIAMTFGITLWLFHWMVGCLHKIESLALAMIIGGAVGNIIDRISYGAVADFIHFHAFDYNFYVFNVADAAISIGVVILLFDGLRGGGNSPKNDANSVDGV